jgi:hypothetical protein
MVELMLVEVELEVRQPALPRDMLVVPMACQVGGKPVEAEVVCRQ